MVVAACGTLRYQRNEMDDGNKRIRFQVASHDGFNVRNRGRDLPLVLFYSVIVTTEKAGDEHIVRNLLIFIFI